LLWNNAPWRHDRRFMCKFYYYLCKQLFIAAVKQEGDVWCEDWGEIILCILLFGLFLAKWPLYLLSTYGLISHLPSQRGRAVASLSLYN
jgi:hypothetical protein